MLPAERNAVFDFAKTSLQGNTDPTHAARYTVLLQWCHCGVTMMLKCHSGVKVVPLWCYSGVAGEHRPHARRTVRNDVTPRYHHIFTVTVAPWYAALINFLMAPLQHHCKTISTPLYHTATSRPSNTAVKPLLYRCSTNLLPLWHRLSTYVPLHPPVTSYHPYFLLQTTFRQQYYLLPTVLSWQRSSCHSCGVQRTSRIF